MTKRERMGVTAAAVMLLLVAGGSWWGRNWLDLKMRKVGIGLAEPRFPYRDRTQEELNKLFPQTKYADVPTRVTPEETYAKFRQGLKENNLEMVLEQLSKDTPQYRDNLAAIKKYYNEGKFVDAYEFYPEQINNVSMYDSIAQYIYDINKDGKLYIQGISFDKDKNGDWKMKNL